MWGLRRISFAYKEQACFRSGPRLRRKKGLTRVTKSYLLALPKATFWLCQKLPFGSGDDPDKLFFHQALNEVSNSSDRELPLSACSEMSGAKDSKAVLSCEWPEGRSLLSLAFLPPGSGKGTPESGDGQPE